MTENISNLIVAAASLCGGIVVTLLAGMAIWTFRDIRSRTRDPLAQILATVMVAVVPIAGILVYFMLRPRETLSEKYVRALEEESLLSSIEDQEFCPTCSRRVGADMQYCPSCHTKLRNPCGHCGRAVHLSWDLCPYCGSGLTPETPAGSINVKRPMPKRVATPQPSAPAKMTQPTSAPQRVQTRLGFGGMLDRVGGAISGMVDKVTTARGEDDPEPPVTRTPLPGGAAPTPPNTTPLRTASGNGTPLQSPKPISSVRKPQVDREELE